MATRKRAPRKPKAPAEQRGTLLYNGEVLLEFDRKTHKYLVTDLALDDQFIVPSVTQVLKVIDKSGPLTQWAANCAIDYMREKLPAFVGNAITHGAMDEIALDELLNEARYNFRKISQRAKDIGTLVHEWVEGYLRWKSKLAREAPPIPGNAEAANGCRAAVEWLEKHSYNVRQPEMLLYSRKHQVAGTMDFPGEVDGRMSVLDWKTSKYVYDEYRLQTAAYSVMYEEMTGEHIRDRWIIRLDKETGIVEPHRFPEFEIAKDFEAFLAFKTGLKRILELQTA